MVMEHSTKQQKVFDDAITYDRNNWKVKKKTMIRLALLFDSKNAAQWFEQRIFSLLLSQRPISWPEFFSMDSFEKDIVFV